MNRPTKTGCREPETAVRAQNSPMGTILALGCAAIHGIVLMFRRSPPIAADLAWPVGFL
jgi:hypothetical protein